MKIGYARVSTNEQNLDLQISALNEAGCEKIYQEKKSAFKERTELDKLLSYARAGDILVVWKMDRLARSLKELVFLIDDLSHRKIDIICLTGNKIDTSTPYGKMIFQLTGIFAEYERNLIVERTNAGLEAARKRGVRLGRKPGLTLEAKRKAELAAKLYAQNTMTVREMAKMLQVSTATFYRYLRINGIKPNKSKSVHP